MRLTCAGAKQITMCEEEDYTDLMSVINGAAQHALGYIVALIGFIVLSPLLLLKGFTLDRIGGWFERGSNIIFRILPVIFLPFFVMHELFHIVFMSVALLHPQIKFLGWMKPTFHTAETFSVGMRMEVPEDDERTPAIHMFVLLICLAPALAFIPTAWVMRQTTNLYLLAYLLLGSLWCIPSSGDRMVIRDTVNSIRHKTREAQSPPAYPKERADAPVGSAEA